MLVTTLAPQQEIGSVLASGAGAVAESSAVKAKAQANSSTAVGYPSAVVATGPSLAARASVIDFVTGPPKSVLESSRNSPTARLPTATIPTPMMGPAPASAKVAAPAVPEIPKEGPAIGAVGRVVAAGIADPTRVKGTKASVPIGKKYQVVFVTGKEVPFSQTGGLGEALDDLPTALAALGHRVMVISPRYDLDKEAGDTSLWRSVKMAGKDEAVNFSHTFKQKVDYVFVDPPTYLKREDGLRGADDQVRFAYFCKAALVAIQDLPLGGFAYGHQSVIVSNDWQSGLVPMFIHSQRSADPTMWKAVFQGRFEYEEGLAHVFDVPQQYMDDITYLMPLKVGKTNEKVKTINTMAAGIRYSDRAFTVSPNYAKDCATDPEKGVELEQLFALGRVSGILNGVKDRENDHSDLC
jgi:hypothetical protein